MTKENSVSVRVAGINLYEVKGDTDTCEGRGSRYVIGYFTDLVVANEAAQGKGVFGGPGYVTSVAAFKLECDGYSQYYLDKPIEVKSITNEELKRQAIAKLRQTLSQEEISVLGLKL